MTRQLSGRPISGRLVIATHNAGKLVEMRELLAPYAIEAVSAGDLGLAEPEETGSTFIANALIKAQAAAEASGLPAMADDSGLCVAALMAIRAFIRRAGRVRARISVRLWRGSMIY